MVVGLARLKLAGIESSPPRDPACRVSGLKMDGWMEEEGHIDQRE